MPDSMNLSEELDNLNLKSILTILSLKALDWLIIVRNDEN